MFKGMVVIYLENYMKRFNIICFQMLNKVLRAVSLLLKR